MNSTIVRFISLCTFFCLLLQSSESQRLKQGASDWYMRYHGIFDKHKRPQRLQWQTGNEFDGSDFTGNRYTGDSFTASGSIYRPSPRLFPTYSGGWKEQQVQSIRRPPSQELYLPYDRY